MAGRTWPRSTRGSVVASVPKGKRKLPRPAPAAKEPKAPRRQNVRHKKSVPLDRIEFDDGNEREETTRAAVILAGLNKPDRQLLLQELLRESIAGKPKRVQLAVVRDIARSVDA